MADSNVTTVVVTGDLTQDWHLGRVERRESPGWDDQTEAYHQYGGAGLLIDTIGQFKKTTTPGLDVRQPTKPRSSPSPADRTLHHSFAEWTRQPKRKDKPSDGEVWRVRKFLGVAHCGDDLDEPGASKPRDDPRHADVVVLDDADMGFRTDSASWPDALQDHESPPQWVVVKMTRTIANGPLWESLHEHHAERLVVVMTINDLRRNEVQISRALSWERTAQDVYWALENHPDLKVLRDCAHVVVSFHTAGALLLSRQGDGPCRLFFDPAVLEGEWEKRYPGLVIGYTSCLTAAIVRQIIEDPDGADIAAGIQSGVAAMRELHLQGYGRDNEGESPAGLRFPAKLVAEEITKASGRTLLAETDVPKSQPVHARAPVTSGARKAPEDWTILKQVHGDNLDGLARRIVTDGPDSALQAVPLGSFGKLLTVDRHEIEGFRSIGSLIDQYSRQERPDRPLSIAVFGPPGSGKSFGVHEVARSSSDGIEQLTFNLAQLHDSDDLAEAMHRVRNAGIGGKLPLVFWDEFDSEELKWLRHFLAPMQDGAFQSRQTTHAIGPAIFVFAGGTARTMGLFGRSGLRIFGQNKGPDFRAVKGPDFVSRLKGFVDISGPDPRDSDPMADPYFVVRRAVLLRSILKRSHSSLIGGDNGKQAQVDGGVLRALLKISSYKHGARSIESIVNMSELYDKSYFGRSALPAEPQLGLHVNAEEFIRLVHEPDDT